VRTPTKTNKDLIPLTIDAFWGSVPPIWNQIKKNIRSIASDQFEISIGQFHILRHIRKGTTSVSELAEVKQISRSAISQAVEVLVARGLIRRTQNSNDRRNIPLELTDSGNELLDKIFKTNRAWMKDHLKTLSEQELKTITAAMNILNKTFLETPE
jgi:DNA-binding MarR family transcriptional regulator